MTVVGDVVDVVDEFSGIARSPGFVHHLYVEIVVFADAEVLFNPARIVYMELDLVYSPRSTPKEPGSHVKFIRIVVQPHRISLFCFLDWLVDNSKHPHVTELVFLVDLSGHPIEKIHSSLELVVTVQAGIFCILTSKGILRRLRPRKPMQVDDNVQARIASPPAERLEVIKPTLREIFTVTIDSTQRAPE